MKILSYIKILFLTAMSFWAQNLLASNDSVSGPTVEATENFIAGKLAKIGHPSNSGTRYFDLQEDTGLLYFSVVQRDNSTGDWNHINQLWIPLREVSFHYTPGNDAFIISCQNGYADGPLEFIRDEKNDDVFCDDCGKIEYCITKGGSATYTYYVINYPMNSTLTTQLWKAFYHLKKRFEYEDMKRSEKELF